MRELHDLRLRLEDALEELAAELQSVRPLLSKLLVQEPDEIELRAIALTLHGFYNGAEPIFLFIAKNYDGQVPTGLRWHRQLPDQMNTPTEKRQAILDTEYYDVLVEYLGFRHIVRHTYPGSLKWERFREIAQNLPDVQAKLQQSVHRFVSSVAQPLAIVRRATSCQTPALPLT